MTPSGAPFPEISRARPFQPGVAPKATPWAWLAVATGVIGLALGLVLAPARALESVLIMQHYTLSLALGGLFFVALMTVSRGGWHVAFRRVPEAMGATLWLPALLIVPVMAGMVLLYPWAEASVSGETLSHYGHEMSPLKQAWLSPAAWVARLVVVFVCWFVFLRPMLRHSRRQDESGDIGHSHGLMRWSAGFIVVFAATFTLFNMDILMSRTPFWFSTMYGVYGFADAFLTALATMTLIVLWLRETRVFTWIRPGHLHNLGKLILAFSTFWAYIWFSQYLLIWYSNIPEETEYYIPRFGEGWFGLTMVSLVLNWVIPFVLLMPAAMKRNATVLAWVCAIVLVGQWLDRYLLVAPDSGHGSPSIGLLEASIFVGALGGFWLAFRRAFGSAGMLPHGDPYLAESMTLET